MAMKVILVGMGCETITLESLSAVLKARGHDVELTYDEALFDDLNYLTMPRVARLFSMRDTLVDSIVASNPSLVGFTVLTASYQWSLDVARRIKSRINVPIIFGGIHPTSVPEVVVQEKCVDMVCIGEGEEALIELVESMESGKDPAGIRNLWFKRNGQVIRNDMRPPRLNLDDYPIPDKSLFERQVPIPYYYLAVTSRGCPYACNFCSLSLLAEQARNLGVNPLRERSVENVMYELKAMQRRYGYLWIDIKNNTFPANRRWTLEFLKRYKEEIGLPLRVFGHPLKIDREIARALKKANCWRVQMGIESFSEEVRKNILGRHESNEDIRSACRAMDEEGLSYSLDFIMGLPGQTEEEYVEAAEFFADCRKLVRVTPFWIEYLPGTPLVEIAARLGAIGPEEIRRLELGLDPHYVSTGSVRDPSEVNRLKGWHLFFRMIPTTPKPVVKYIIARKLWRFFPYLPIGPLVFVMDFIMSYIIGDRSATTYIKTYAWHFRKRIKKLMSDE